MLQEVQIENLWDEHDILDIDNLVHFGQGEHILNTIIGRMLDKLGGIISML